MRKYYLWGCESGLFSCGGTGRKKETEGNSSGERILLLPTRAAAVHPLRKGARDGAECGLVGLLREIG